MKHVGVDLEMNGIPKESEAYGICASETIEIGAVMLDDSLQEISAFRVYVKPEHRDNIEGIISDLTGITDDMVENAPKFNEALNMFTKWCLGTGDDVKIYAWSENDYAQISKEIILKRYEVSDEENDLLNTEWSDFQKEFDSRLGFQRRLSLKSALEMAEISFTGREHDALDDARNTSKLLQLVRDEKLFNKTLIKIKDLMKPKRLATTIGDLIDLSAFGFGEMDSEDELPKTGTE